MNKYQIRKFLNSAEKAWLNVVDSAWPYRGNLDEYTLLPLRYNSRKKILNYFRRQWGVALSNTMICNLRLRTYKKRLYLPQGDPPPVALIVKSVIVSQRCLNKLVVHATVVGDPSGPKRIIYFIRKRDSGRWEITGRTKKNNDVRYKSCR